METLLANLKVLLPLPPMVVGVDDCNYYHHKLNYGEPRGPKLLR